MLLITACETVRPRRPRQQLSTEVSLFQLIAVSTIIYFSHNDRVGKYHLARDLNRFEKRTAELIFLHGVTFRGRIKKVSSQNGSQVRNPE